MSYQLPHRIGRATCWPDIDRHLEELHEHHAGYALVIRPDGRVRRELVQWDMPARVDWSRVPEIAAVGLEEE